MAQQTGGTALATDITWAEPPPVKIPARDGPRRGSRKDLVEVLKSTPGEWAQYRPGHGHGQSAAGLFKRDFPGIDSTCRSRGDGTYDVYVRWLGDEAA